MGLQAEREFNLANARYQPLVVVFVAVSIGIVTDYLISVSLTCWLCISVSGLLAWLALRRRPWQLPVMLLLLFAVASVGGAWHHVYWRLYDDEEIGFAASAGVTPVCLEAIAQSAPRVRAAPADDPMSTMPGRERTVFIVSATRVRDGTSWRKASGLMQLTSPGHVSDVRAGDRLRIFGSLSPASPPLNPGEFDFARSQRQRRMLCRMSVDAPECIAVLEPSSWWNPRTAIHAIRGRSNEILATHLQPEQAELASAILLGIREQVDSQRIEMFMTTGTIHLLAISGLHVGMLAAGFWVVARLGWLSRRRTLYLAIVLFVFYALFTDAKPPVVRAAVLISVMCTARLLGRRAFAFNTLALAGLILLIVNPTNLFQTGTQLSFLAVATLSCSQRVAFWLAAPDDPLQRLISQSRPWPMRALRRTGVFVWQLCVASTVIWLVALPLVMYRFHLVSPIAALLNPVVWVPMGVALFSGFGVLLFGWTVPPLADLSGWVCDRSLSLIETSVLWAAEIPFGHAWVPSPPLWWVLLFYGGLAIGVAFPRFGLTIRWLIATLSVWFAIGFALTVGPLARSGSLDGEQLACTFIAVGHGTSVLIEFPDGKTMLYDGGSLGSSRFAARPISATLWSRGITHLDAIVISHADADHYNAVPGILKQFSVGVVYVSPVMFREPTPALEALRTAIHAAHVPLRELDATSHLGASAGVEMEILHPPPQGIDGSDNANSIVLRIGYQGHTILLPGDLESPGLEDVLAESPRDCGVVMAPHHGSPRSDPLSFSAWTTPEHVAISGGAGRDVGAVRWAYEHGGAVVTHTAIDGAIRFEVSSAGIKTVTHVPSITKHYGKEGKQPDKQ
ncbi:MAG: ComEC/Rec2 family competence protein [Planctomycetes bacterium]|nr:ComEC/Rec2 family competence protein [Planctomycetota bacterium]